MKIARWTFAVIIFLHLNSGADAQVTNLTFNGVSSNFTVIQGDSVWWEYDLPVGGVADGEIWLDLDSNGIINPLTDRQLFGDFTQTDGVNSGEGGPGDMDNAVNGHIFFGASNLGFAPAHYLFKFSNNSVGQTIAGTVTALISPSFTVSGTVTPPPLISAQNILVTGEGDGGMFWMGLTDAGGNYTINFNASASGRLMKFSVMDEFPPYISGDTLLTMTGSYSGINFAFTQPDAYIVGYLMGGVTPLADVVMYAGPQYGGGNKTVRTDVNGFYQFGFSLNEINAHPIWRVQSSSGGVAPDYFPPESGMISLHQYDSIRVDLVAPVANDSITGRITVDGQPPENQSFRIYSYVVDSGQTETLSDPHTGNFTLHVTRNYYNYHPGVNNLPQEYGYDWDTVVMHPGQTNIILNIATINWLPQASNTNGSLRAISFVNSDMGWVAGSDGIVLSTTNSGLSWSGQTTNTSDTINGIYFISPTIGWFVGDGGVIKKTIDGGANWTSQNSGLTDNLYAVQFIDANTGWAVGGSSGSGGKILKTINGGGHWSYVYGGSQRFYSICMVNAAVGWAGGSEIMKTTDGGATWNFQASFDTYSLDFTDTTTGWAVGWYHEAYATTNGGSEWTWQTVDQHDIRSVYALDESTAWIAASNGHIFVTTDGGSHWVKSLTGTRRDLYAIHMIDADFGWAVGDNGTILHRSGGGCFSVANSWNLLSVPLTVSDYSKTVLYPAAISQAFYFDNGYYPASTLENGKGYWIKFPSPRCVSMIGEDRHADTIAVASGWNMIGTLSVPISAAGVGSIPGGIVTSSFFEFGGSGYQASSTLDPGKGYWVKVNQAGQLMLNSAGSIPAASRIQIIDKGEMPPSPPEDETLNSSVPGEYMLEQNYPNPFNPTTTIRFFLPERSYVRISVFNILGVEMSVLIDGVHEAGYRSVSFNAHNLPSGVYVYRITAGRFTDIKKMLVLK